MDTPILRGCDITQNPEQSGFSILSFSCCKLRFKNDKVANFAERYTVILFSAWGGEIGISYIRKDSSYLMDI